MKTNVRDLALKHVSEVIYVIKGSDDISHSRMEFMSNSVERMLGYSPDEFIETPNLWYSIIHPKDLDNVKNSLRQILNAKASTTLTYRLRHKKTLKYQWVEDAISPEANGKGVLLIGSVREITNKKCAEPQLVNEERQAFDSFEDMIIGTYRTTPDGTILSVNQALLDMLGFKSIDELKKRNLGEEGYEPAYSRDEFRRRLERDKMIIGLESIWTRNDGGKFFARENARVVYNDNGDDLYYEGTVEDISDRKPEEDEAARLNGLLRTLSDINELIVRERGGDDLFKEVCRIIVGNGEYPMASIGKLDEDGKVVHPFAWFGVQDGHMRDILLKREGEYDEEEPADSVIRTDNAFVWTDIESEKPQNNRMTRWRENARKKGARSGGCFPIHAGGKVIGVLDVFGVSIESFGEEEIKLLSQLSDDIGFAMWTTEVQAKEKAANEMLRNERILLRTLIDNLPLSIFIKDKQYRKTIINRAHLRSIVEQTNRPELGFESAILGKTDFDVYPKELAKEFMVDNEKVIRDGQAIINREELRVLPGGRKRWTMTSKIPLRDKSGEIIGMLGMATDITDSKVAEQAKEQETILLRTLIDNLPSAVFIKDDKYRKTLVNPKHVRDLAAHLGALGLDKRIDVVGKTDFEIYPKDLAEEYFIEDQKVIRDGVSVVNEERQGVSPDGKESWNLISKIPLRNKEGAITGLVGIYTDITTLKRNEEVIARERVLLRTLIDIFPYGIYVKDVNYRKVISNPVDVNFSGFSCEEDVIGKTDYDLYPKEVADQFFLDDQKVIRDGESVLKREERLPDLNGKEHWLLTSKVPLRDKKGAVTGLVGVGVDITKERELDRALRTSEAELRALFESMKDVILVLDRDGRYLKVMSSDSVLYKPASEMIGKTNHEVFPKQQADLFLFVIRKTLESGEPQNVEYAMKIGDEEKWRFATATQLTENSVLWVARDITELKLKQKEITESEGKYRELVENSLVGVFKVNLSGHITYANKSMAEMLEYSSPKELMSVNSLDLYVSDEDREDLIGELRKNRKTEKNKEVKFITRSGKVKNVLISASLDGTVISAMVKDITDMRVLEQQFIQTQKLEGLGNIAAGIAHDFNNLLGVIIGYSDLLTQSKYEQQKFERGIRAINKAADRGRSLVKQLLTFARKTATTFDSLIVNDIVIEIERLLAETFPKTIEIRTELQKNLPPILADSTQIHQVLLNLCVNARDAMPRGGRLSVATRIVEGSTLSSRHPDALSAEYVEIRVSDTGIGMDEEIRRHIFEPFFTTKGVGKGTGLGLSVVYGIVESHRGFISVVSEIGKGTTFSVYFPVQQQAIEQTELKSNAPESTTGGSETVLIIEDEEMLRDLLRTILESKGYAVISARDGKEGVQMFSENKDKVALVVCDLGLPKLSGEEVVSNIRQTAPDAKLIIASGFIDPDIKADLEKLGVISFILKPYKTNEVLHVIHDAIAGAP